MTTRGGMRAVRGEDGILYLCDANEEPVTDPSDDDYVRGGHRVVSVGKRTVKITTEGGEVIEKEEDVLEITTRAAGGGAGNRDKAPSAFVIPKKRADRLKVCRELWANDPLAGNITTTTTTFTLGRGFEIIASDLVEKVLRKFWKRNDGAARAATMCDEGVVYGDNFLKLTVYLEDVEHPNNPQRTLWKTGQVSMQIIPPQVVAEVEHDPLNVEDVKSWTLKWKGEKKAGSEDREEKSETLPDFSKFDPDEHAEDGRASCLIHLKFNALSQDVFGHGDLLRIKEWLDNYLDFLRDSVVINKLYRSPCYDITIKDADDREVRKAIRQYQDWEIGTNPVHNDREEWKVLEFTGANVSQESSRRAILLVCAAGVNLPEYMLADGSNANLASAKAQQLPAIKKFEKRQEDYRRFWIKVFTFVLDMAQTIGKVPQLAPEEDFDKEPIWPVDVRFPPLIVEKDKDIAEANRIGIEDEWLSPQTAAARAGVNYDDERKLRLEAAKNKLRDDLELEAFQQSEDFLAMRAELGVANEDPPGSGLGEDGDDDDEEEDDDIRVPVNVDDPPEE